MNRAIGLRTARQATRLRPFHRSACLGLGVGAATAGMVLGPFSQTVRFDAMPAGGAPAFQQSRGMASKGPDPQVVKQVSSGSVTGFATGLVVALFSRTLVFLGGLLAVASFFASRQGIDLPHLLGVKKLLNKSSFWQKSARNPLFAASFAVTFTLAAFVRL